MTYPQNPVFSASRSVSVAESPFLHSSATGCFTALQHNLVDALYQSCVHPKPWYGEDRREDPLVQNFRRVRGAKGQQHVDTLFYQTCYEVLSNPAEAEEIVLGRLPELSIPDGAHPTAWHTRHTEREFVGVLMDRMKQGLAETPKMC